MECKNTKCEICKVRNAAYTMQRNEDGEFVFALPGFQRRGMPVIARVCQSCADKIQNGQIAVMY